MRRDGSGSGLFKRGFDLREGHSGRVEVLTIRRREAEFGPGFLDRLADRQRLLGRQIVRHHDVAGAQAGHQDLLDIGLEASPSHCPVEGNSAVTPPKRRPQRTSWFSNVRAAPERDSARLGRPGHTDAPFWSKCHTRR